MAPINYADTVSIFKAERDDVDDSSVDVFDRQWLKDVFLVGDDDLSAEDQYLRYISTADIKINDTSLGGSLACNAPPQACRYADPRSKGRLAGRNETTIRSTTNLGMGMDYSTRIDDNQLRLYLEFGVPEFNNIFTFFTRAIDYKTSVIATTGRSPIAYDLGKITGTAVAFLAFPMITSAILLMKLAKTYMLGSQPLKYYYFKPNMHTYWSTVNGLVTTFSTELGIILPELMDEKDLVKSSLGLPLKLDKDQLDELHQIAPNLIHEDGYIDVMAIALRAQHLASMQKEQEYAYYMQHKDNLDDKLAKGYLDLQNDSVMKPTKTPGLADYIDHITKIGYYQKYVNEVSDLLDDEGETSTISKENDTSITDAVKEGKYQSPTDDEGRYDIKDSTETDNQNTWASYFDSSYRQGGAYAIFAVNKVGSVTETFTNSVTNIPAGDQLKSVTHGIKNVKFNFAGGNLLGDTMTDIMGYAKDLAAGTLSGVTLGLSNVVMSMLGGAYMDIPKMWDDSSVSLPTITYNFKLISQYNNPISQLKHIYMPLSMIMAGSLPLSSGAAAYVSPLLCRSYLKGIQDIDMGMITQLSITRSTSNLPYSKTFKPLAFDVSFTITDFSSIMTARVDSSLFSSINNTLDDGSLLSRYVRTITARDLITNKFVMKRLKLRLSRMAYAADQATSAAYWGFRVGQVMEAPLGGLVAGHTIALTEEN